MDERKRLTIEELETILNNKQETNVEILPNGEVRAISKRAIEIAARVWQDQEMRQIAMDDDACIDIAQIIDKVLTLDSASRDR